MPRPRPLTITEAAEQLARPVSTLYKWSTQRRELQPTWRIGRRLLYAQQDVDRYLDSKRVDGRRLVA
jgi:excisionase family DNA binding protein